MAVTVEAAADATAIRPFTFEFPDEELEALRARIAATRWPEREPVDDGSQGVQLATIQAIARYWAQEYDWRACEARLRAVPHFVTEIDGLDIHFIHVRSRHEDALPLIVTHGWPGSIVEQLKIVGPLTDPTAHGASASDAFHLVIPSMPGYGFSGKPATTGWGPKRIARAWAQLMERLGYTRYAAQGGDWGAIVTDLMAVDEPPGLVGMHTNMAGTVPADVGPQVAAGAPAPAGLPEDEAAAWNRLSYFLTKGIGYAVEMGLRPQTLYGLADSPVALAAWMLDHDIWSYEMISGVFVDGADEGLTRDDFLDNVTLFWLTNTGVSASRLYLENDVEFFSVKGVSLPVAVSVFPEDLYQPPRSWAERAYPGLVHFNALARGGHFAAWEQPQLFCDEVRAGLRSLR
jgi:pimeloyl-ACP methyl ester carboxylesterase